MRNYVVTLMVLLLFFAWSVPAAGQDLDPPVDGVLVATEGNGEILLNWFGFSDPGGIARYTLVVSEQSFPFDCTGSSPGEVILYSGLDTSYPHTGLPYESFYTYLVCATDNADNTSYGAYAFGTAGEWAAKVLRNGTPAGKPYMSIGDAYKDAQIGDVIQARSTFFVENLNLDKAVPVLLDGGYEYDYSVKLAEWPTYICGTVTIGSNSGPVTIDKFEIWPGP